MGVGRAPLDSQAPGSLNLAKFGGLDSWGPMVRTAAGPGCAGQRPQLVRVLRMRVQVPMQIQGRGRLTLARPPRVPCSLGTLASRPPGPGSWAVGGWRQGDWGRPSPPPVVPASESPSALAMLITLDRNLSLGGAALALPTPSAGEPSVAQTPRPQLKKGPPPMKLMETQESH